MEQENKYYTPSIEELHVGFEVEIKAFILDGYIWDKGIIKHPREIEQFIKWIMAKCVRIKYLDQKDIEECGFTFVDNRGMSENNGLKFTKPDPTFQQACFIIDYWPNVNRVCINRINGTLFEGIIKNKSELKRILKMIGIDE